MTPRRRARLVLLVIAVAIVGLGVLVREPLWWLVATRRVLFTNDGSGFGLHDDRQAREHWIRGWYRVHRWTGAEYLPTCTWYSPSGFKAEEINAGDGTPYQVTRWNPDGSISLQLTIGGEVNKSPPWLWGATDQTAPSAPAWILDDVQWQAALDAQEGW